MTTDREPKAQRRLFRREKVDPASDAKHTLAVGIPLAVILMIALPFLFHALGVHP